ncbi:hypothetical protein ACQPXM_01975 [Kribbella sp. CA-253562]|uniref:hypothetical protein n=1 Tax=Kribbella sp. CA-253562 TaxID=3239942 RepID=UPI003D8AF35B
MDYDQFDTEYRRVSEAARTGASDTVLAAELARLRTLAAAITDPADRADAEHDIAGLADVLAHDDEPRPSPPSAP